MASARSVDLHGLAAGAKGDVELGFAGVYPGNDRGIVCHLLVDHASSTNLGCSGNHPDLMKGAVRDPAEPHPRTGSDELDPTDGRPVLDGHPGPGTAHATPAD